MLVGLYLILTKCSVEKNTGATRFYHSMTARYNIYFNGYENFKTGLVKIENGYQDDYAEMLRVFEFSDPASASLCASDMERAIQKASKLISLKSITAKPEKKEEDQLSDLDKSLLERKEYNEWVDDSYLLIAKARFYKHEFNEATAVFDYSINSANDLLIRKEATIWLARIYTETGNYSESLRILKELEINTDFSKSLLSMYYTSLADLFIRQKKYSEAIEPLEKSIDLVSGKRTRYRLTYLLAQLFEQTGDGSKASALFRQVVKMNPPYDVEFNARINIAGAFDINSGDPREMKRDLEKMLRNSKNRDFHDQIYFALGNLAMKEGNETEALEFYRKSANAAMINLNQKGRAYLALADYYFKIPDYIKAGMFYDSVLYFLDQKHPDYTELNLKSQNLNALVSELIIIQTEDSLQRVASMSEAERNAYIESIIAKVVSDENAGKLSETSDNYNLGQYYENERRFQENIDREGKWYFYNQAALTFGRTEFRRRWGTRKLEDNWRRSNRARVNISQVTENNGEISQNENDTSTVILDNKKPEFYLMNLPLTDSLLTISNEKISYAVLNAGKAYSERMQDQTKATETFESLITRFPESELVPETLFLLYKINKDENNAKSEAYRQRLLQKYPESEFARILSDPEYYEKIMAEQRITENLYMEAYDKYLEEKYDFSVSICDDGLTRYPKSNLAPKFMLLKAYCIAKISDERAFKEALNLVIESWPETVESKKADEIISFLNQALPELKVEEDRIIASELYLADSSAIHSFILLVADPGFNVNLATFDVISYNIDNYTNNNYKTEGQLIDNKYVMITVSGFSDYNTAFDYYNSFNVEKLVRNPRGSKILSFIISDENLKVLNNDKDPGRYQMFFNENYLK